VGNSNLKEYSEIPGRGVFYICYYQYDMKRKKKNPLDEVMEELEQYDKGCPPATIANSGE